VNVSFLQELFATIAEQGRQLLPRSLVRAQAERGDLSELVAALLSVRGEASGIAIARTILDRYRGFRAPERRRFLEYLAETLQPDPEVLARAARSYLDVPGQAALAALQRAVESPRQEFFRRLNSPPGATAEIVAMRRDLLDWVGEDPLLARVDADLMHLLSSWFNRGFLVLQRIDWQTPAAVLEKIIAYEAVHQIQGWNDLRRRLDPRDRRCFAFFHPSLIDEPLIFVEVALTSDIPDNIHSLLEEAPKGYVDGDAPRAAVFYSISNCQEGLRGISFGSFLIKRVVDDLLKEQPSLRTFATLSPLPGFAKWLRRALEGGEDEGPHLEAGERERLAHLGNLDPQPDPEHAAAIKTVVTRLAAHYLVVAKGADGRPVDPVARFHLGNGARLERINWPGDTSPKGMREALGVMVNYRYDVRDIEKNHEAFANTGAVATSRQVRALLKAELSLPETDVRRRLTSARPRRTETSE
jgi:malonyl-CoA decarboxylase